MEGRELKAAALVLAGFFVLGAVAGGCYALVSAHSVKTNKYNTAHLTQHLQYAEVEAGRLQCVVLLDKAELYNLKARLLSICPRACRLIIWKLFLAKIRMIPTL